MQHSLALMPQLSPRELAELLPAVVQLHHQRAAGVGAGEGALAGAGAGARTGAGDPAAAAPGHNQGWGIPLAADRAGPSPSSDPDSAANSNSVGAGAGPGRRRRTGPLLMQQRSLLLDPAGSRSGMDPSVAAPPPLLDPAWTLALLESCRFKLTRFTAQVSGHGRRRRVASVGKCGYTNVGYCNCPA